VDPNIVVFRGRKERDTASLNIFYRVPECASPHRILSHSLDTLARNALERTHATGYV
jgi:hypothetical protein